MTTTSVVEKVENAASKEAETEISLFGEETVVEAKKPEISETPSDIRFRENDDAASQPLLALTPVALDKPETVSVGSLRTLLPYIDELDLFEKRWGYDKGAASRDEWCVWARREIVPVFENLLNYCEKNDVFDLRASYVYVEAVAENETVSFFKADGSEPFYAHTFKRFANDWCVADCFGTFRDGSKDTAALMLVTCGKKAQSLARKWKNNAHETDYRYLNGLALECVAAMKRYVLAQINNAGACVGNAEFLGGKETDSRAMRPLLDVCNAAALGVSYNKADMLVPEYAEVFLVCPR